MWIQTRIGLEKLPHGWFHILHLGAWPPPSNLRLRDTISHLLYSREMGYADHNIGLVLDQYKEMVATWVSIHMRILLWRKLRPMNSTKDRRFGPKIDDSGTRRNLSSSGLTTSERYLLWNQAIGTQSENKLEVPIKFKAHQSIVHIMLLYHESSFRTTFPH